MLQLAGHCRLVGSGVSPERRLVKRLTTDTGRPTGLRRSEAFLSRSNHVPDGFSCYVIVGPAGRSSGTLGTGAPVVLLGPEFDYLADGDVIGLDAERGRIRVLFRKQSNHNSFLVTEQCNHYCLMCSQPPKNIDDSWILREIAETIPMVDPATAEIGFTGGEPTLFGDEFLGLLRLAKNYLPRTAVHILSNGRRFADMEFCRGYARIEHPDMMVGIPLYSDDASIHNYVVQADGAFDETVLGILNLLRLGQKVEIRVVVHKETIGRLEALAEYITRNLPSVDHVALMGLEMMGFARANLEQLWIDPFDYRETLYRAVTRLGDFGVNVSIYNHQLCVLDPRARSYARKSISDWKNEYMPECAGCSQMPACGGFFSSASLRYSSHIGPL